ncbi:DUF481 domain-containing protein [Gramella lutea]|uniref:DUF481 domain-containing protein n=1 Tax=Christiangramia lutea TaxID=1607951 RepID=A0A9X1V554_9FLAO|nr:DUF481 domain-containing protein [Christiangramia lutea]MCH4823866.1 DUF481 domain-containing protein [Christiangramia lutea]
MKRFLLLTLLFLINLTSHAQKDSLVFTNNNIMVGEVKSLDKGVITIETDYSDSDFKIEWDKVKELFSESTYLINLTDGRRLNGTIKSVAVPDWEIYRIAGDTVKVRRDEIVYFKSYEQDFWSRVTASIDADYSFTKANNFNQIGGRANIGYTAPKWWLKASYSLLRSNQDDVEPVKRQDGSISYRAFLKKDWYFQTMISFLSNTEQLLNLRTNLKAGMGKFIIHTNVSYLAVEGGVSGVNENFESQMENQNSLEAYLGSELDLYDVGDWSLLTRLIIYPSLTESGRWRADYVLDTKYDLPLDFYIKAGLTVNYDNQAVEGAADLDYVVQTGIGWEFN